MNIWPNSLSKKLCAESHCQVKSPAQETPIDRFQLKRCCQ